MSTAIEWTDATWNPVTGCTKVSPGCAFCYIDRTPPFRMENRRFMNGATDVRLHPDRLDMPLRWRKPRRIFVNSLSDVWHEDVPDEFIDRMFATMAICGAQRQTCGAGTRCQHEPESTGCWQQGDGRELPVHTFQVLTKRPERMRAYLSDEDRFQRIVDVGNDPEWHIKWGEPEDMIDGVGWPLPNVGLGVSVENQRMADERIPLLLETPAAVRFLSVEPLLGPVSLSPYLSEPEGKTILRSYYQGPGGSFQTPPTPVGPARLIDWVIVGGESGGPEYRRLVKRCSHSARPRHISSSVYCHQCNETGWLPKPAALSWVRSLRDQCVAAEVPFFMKQWGGPRPKSGGRLLDGVTWDEMPQRQAAE